MSGLENNDTVFRYVLNSLSVLTNDELCDVDFEAGTASLDELEISPEERNKLKSLFVSIQKELPLYHHGIKGMRWGVRRYQNKDGSLTAKGQERAANDAAKQTIFGTAQRFQVKTRSGEVITAEPRAPSSLGKRIVKSLLGKSEKDEMGYRGDANYTLHDSNGKKIGELSLISKDSKTTYWDWITIDEKQRGKGYATDILNTLLTKATDAGYSKVEMHALEKPRPLYERLGFTYTDTSKLSALDRVRGFEIGTKRMEYDLTNFNHSCFGVAQPWSYNYGGSMDYYNQPDELYHHGIKGMRWGVRRTKAQLSRGGKSKKGSTDDWSDDAKEAANIRKKSVKQMSNSELKKLNERTALERNYNNLNPSKIKRGLAVAGAIAGGLGTVATLYNNSANVVKIGKGIADKFTK